MITKDRIKEVLEYDEVSGVFFWKKNCSKRKKGDIAGSVTCHGYIRISIDGVRYGAHKLAWILINGEYQNNLELDHINGVKADNRISNLRLVTHSVNLQNKRKMTGNNKSGYFGVAKRGNRFSASIMTNRKPTWLGTFDTPEEAHAAYVEAKRKLHEGCTI